mmetsp:Transcript_58213/g.96405  ORF Transcript_58213/g.96405 Transcript_58213/m.96405 type:complete len:227 (-) Transcript_58213:294-974(-)
MPPAGNPTDIVTDGLWEIPEGVWGLAGAYGLAFRTPKLSDPLPSEAARSSGLERCGANEPSPCWSALTNDAESACFAACRTAACSPACSANCTRFSRSSTTRSLKASSMTSRLSSRCSLVTRSSTPVTSLGCSTLMSRPSNFSRSRAKYLLSIASIRCTSCASSAATSSRSFESLRAASTCSLALGVRISRHFSASSSCFTSSSSTSDRLHSNRRFKLLASRYMST